MGEEAVMAARWVIMGVMSRDTADGVKCLTEV